MDLQIEQHIPKKKAGRRKINIEFIEDKSRRQITFSKRKAGLMKKVSFVYIPTTLINSIYKLQITKLY